MKPKGDNDIHAKPPNHEGDLLSILQMANILGISPRTIYSRVNEGIFPIRYKRAGGLIRFEARDLEAFLNKQDGMACRKVEE